MTELETQNLWKKHLRFVPDAVWEQSSTRVLILADNDLTEVSSRVGSLQHLRTLDLGHNKLVAIPEELGHITELRDFLYLHDNQLEALPASLGQLQKLRYLNISENRFAIFPECICSMANLVELRATDNQLRSLPDSM